MAEAKSNIEFLPPSQNVTKPSLACLCHFRSHWNLIGDQVRPQVLDRPTFHPSLAAQRDLAILIMPVNALTVCFSKTCSW